VSRREIVPLPAKAARSSRALLVAALVLGSAAFVLFDSGRTGLAIALAIPAAILGALALQHRLEPFVIHIGLRRQADE
jgi:hypothetical protein